MLWIERLEQAPCALAEPLAWVAAHAEAAAWPLPPPTPDDLADAALAKREGGGPRLLRRRMLRALVARVFDLHPETVRFTREPTGAPGLAGLDAYISTSGCAGWSAVALSPDPVGLDIEAGPPHAALHRWTLLEATQKTRGRGLAEGGAPAGRSWRKDHPGFTATLTTISAHHLAAPWPATTAE